MIRYKFPAAIAFVAAAPAYAADQDTQIWGAVNASIDVSQKFAVNVEVQPRFSDDAERLGQLLLRPSIGYKLGKNTMASFGYAYVETDPIGPSFSKEHRVWQQMTFRIAGDGNGPTVTGRSRLEQRWIKGQSDMGWRYRQQVRATLPLTGKTRAVLWSEPFLNLDDTSWGQRAGLDRWRNSAGISIPVSKAVTIEPGYINQWVVLRGTDRVHHIGNVTLNARF